ncbi:uncharacterized protein LOC119780607 [Cyprinodon tularosa]|uniref:uncharacterized protein LOC119780607 n=1 Tax=Cyprinodon tularosa TaxID=77115 RepID=UPI0018E1F68E|nr:uncharacterized protein LOC119780607 [Cyprinodon tularosa]
MLFKRGMELNFVKHLNDNTAEFKRTLDRIVDKYSKLDDEDEAIAVDISKITTKTLVSYLGRYNKSLESKTQPDLEDQSLNSGTSSNSELHFPHDDDESENQSIYSTELPEDHGADKAMRLLDESCWNWSENEPQPPDQDGDMSSQSYSLAELYPTMVSRIRRAWHRQAVSVAAGSVVRRYRRWRQRPKGILNSTFDLTARPADGALVSYVGRSNNFLDSKTQPDLEDQSLNSDTSSNSELHFPHDDDESENQSVYSTEFPEDHGADKAMRLLDESCWNWSENEPQPPDQDGDVSSQSYSLAELYPTMVSRIRRAWHRQAVSVAAGSVVRRYRRWRQRPKGILNSTFDLTARPADGGTKVSSSKRLVREGSGSLSKSMGIETMPHPILSTVKSLSPRRQFPGRKRRLSIVRHAHYAAVMQGLSKKSCKKSHFEEQIPINGATPSKRHCSDAESSMDQFFKRKGLSGSSQSAYVSTYVAEAPSVPYIYSSQDRQSPFKASRMGTLSRSPHAFSRSPNGYGSTEPMTSRSPAILMPSPPKRSAGLHYPHDSSRSPKSLPHSHLSAQRAESHRGFRQHLSFDSSLSRPVSMSPKQVDEDFKKLYHKFLCCNESNAFNAPPCRLCGRSSEARRVLSPLSLATPALSPHRSNLSKWYMEESEESHPQSKRLREVTFTYSPGSKKQSNETLRRRRLSRSEAGPSFCTAPNSVSETQQPAENVEEWLIKHQPFFAAKAYR